MSTPSDRAPCVESHYRAWYGGSVRWIVVLLLAGSACRTTPEALVGDRGCGDLVAARPPFEVPTGTVATVAFDFRELIGRRDQRQACVYATIDAQHVQLEAFGNMSSEVCVFPKLVVHGGGERQVLVTHCNEREAVGSDLPTGVQVYGHALAYRLLETLGFVALQTSLRALTYEDRYSNTSIENRAAFFLEFLDSLLVRTSATRADDDVQMKDVEPRTVARLVLYEILINNRDWRILDVTSIEGPYFGVRTKEGAHNVFLIRLPTGVVLPVAYDLELSGFVGIPAGIRVLTGGNDRDLLDAIAAPDLLPDEPWLERWMVTRLLDYRRRFPPDVQREAFAHFRAKRAEVEALVDDPTLPQGAHERARRHVDAFYRGLDLVKAIPQTSTVFDLEANATGHQIACAAVPAGTPYLILDPTTPRPLIRLLFKLRVDGDDVTPMCPAGRDGYAPSPSF